MCIKMLHLEGTIVLKDFCVFCKLGIVALRNVDLLNFGAEKTDSDRPKSLLHTHSKWRYAFSYDKWEFFLEPLPYLNDNYVRTMILWRRHLADVYRHTVCGRNALPLLGSNGGLSPAPATVNSQRQCLLQQPRGPALLNFFSMIIF